MKPLDADMLLARIGRRIAEIRADSDLTQEQLAERAGFTHQYLQRVERGRENLSIRSLVRFAKLLDCSLEQLFEQPKTPITDKPRPGRPRKHPRE